MSVFIKNGFFCIVQQEFAELYEKYMYRGYIIVTQRPCNITSYNNIEKLSRYLCNIKYLSCVYSKNIHELCNVLDNDLKTNLST